MKRRCAVILLTLLVMCMLPGCGGKTEKNKIKVGITIQSLKNAYWAGVMDKLKAVMDENGYEYILFDCDDNAATQISQIENFIIAGCDLIMVHPSNPDAVEFVCWEARNAGIKVMCWDDKMENTDVNWVLDNTALGEAIGQIAADFINRHFTADKPAETVVIGYPSTPVLLERGNGIKKGLEKYCNPGVYTIVSEVDGLETNQSQSSCETVLQAHPDAKVFTGVGAGAMMGANEALITKFGKGNIPEDVGVFSTDVTMEQLKSIKASDEATRGIIGFEGSNEDTARACFAMFERIMSGEEFTGENRNIYREIKPIYKEDVEDIIQHM